MSNNFERFGKYLLLEKVATGGMAEVYLAKSSGASGVSKFVAVKRILPQYSDNSEYIEMFKEEAKIAVNLNHSNVVSIFDFGIERGQFFLVMEFVEGQNLRQVLNFMKKSNAMFTVDQIVYVIKEVAAGLDHAHRCLDSQTGRPLNITHRDISPQNVMISYEGDVKVVDFGIAKAESQLENTRAGTIKGKFGYMSPEQAEGSANVDLRTDIFSLGIVMWELLANDRLFASNNEVNTLRKIRDCNPPSLRKINPNIPQELEKICAKTLAKDPMMRYQTSAALNRDLSRFLSTHYPDFATQDFATFMKNLFSVKISEGRKRFMEYSQSAPNVEEEEHTQTASYNDPRVNPSMSARATPPPPPPVAEVDESEHLNLDTNASFSVNLEGLKNDSATSAKKDFNFNSTGQTSGGPRLAPKLEKPRVDIPSPKKRSFIPAAIAIALSAGAFWVYLEKPALIRDISNQTLETVKNTKPEPATSTPQGVTEVSSVNAQDQDSSDQKVIHVQSFPANARIFIDGKDTGLLTPGRVTVKSNSPFMLTLKADGHLEYTKRFIARYDTTFRATLQRAQMAYVDINIINGGQNPVISVNGVRLSERPPISKYPIAANTNIVIRAENPFTGLSTETVVNVGVDQKKSLNLLLSKAGTKPHANR